MVSAVAVIPVGRKLDRYGPRPVLTGGSVLALHTSGPRRARPILAVFFIGWILASRVAAAVF